LQGGFDGTDKIVASENPEIQTYTQYNQFNFLGKVRFRPNEKLEINVSGNHSQTSVIPRYDRLIVYKNDKLRYGEWYYGPQILTIFSGHLQYETDYKLFDKLSLLGGFQNYTESRYDRTLTAQSETDERKIWPFFQSTSIWVKLLMSKTICFMD
jgi:hemoglobin/transferrin/lactoferrin receptor protein